MDVNWLSISFKPQVDLLEVRNIITAQRVLFRQVKFKAYGWISNINAAMLSDYYFKEFDALFSFLDYDLFQAKKQRSQSVLSFPVSVISSRTYSPSSITSSSAGAIRPGSS